MARIAAAFRQLASCPGRALLHRYETRLHLYQDTLPNVLLLRTPGVRNEPNPISGQSGPEALNDSVPIDAVINDAVPIEAVPVAQNPGRPSEMRLPKPRPAIPRPLRSQPNPRDQPEMISMSSGNDKSSWRPSEMSARIGHLSRQRTAGHAGTQSTAKPPVKEQLVKRSSARIRRAGPTGVSMNL